MTNSVASMTGFASVSGEVPGGRFQLELKSVNHRYLEFQTRMPEDLRSLEHIMRELVAARQAQDAAHCSYISLGSVSDNARRFAQGQGVELVSDRQLAVLLCTAQAPTATRNKHG